MVFFMIFKVSYVKYNKNINIVIYYCNPKSMFSLLINKM